MVEIKEHGLAMKPELVLKTRENIKTQTRRLMVPGNCNGTYNETKEWNWDDLDFTDAFVDGAPKGLLEYLKVSRPVDESRHRLWSRIEVGDALWIKEEHLITIEVEKGVRGFLCEYKDGEFIFYSRDRLGEDTCNKLDSRVTIGKWQRARYIPKAMARIWCQVNSVRVEQLGNISESDAIAEGIDEQFVGGDVGFMFYDYLQKKYSRVSAVRSFRSLWEKIHGDWVPDVWLWVYGYDVLSKNGRPEVISNELKSKYYIE